MEEMTTKTEERAEVEESDSAEAIESSADEAARAEASVSDSAPVAETLVRVENLSKHYGPIKAVDGASFEVRRGDILGFLGPNGAGKTTAMRLITGFLDPDGGRVEVCGHDLAKSSLAARQKIGYLPENAPAYGEMTVTGFLRFVAEARGIADPDAAIARVIQLAELRRVQHQTIETLSKGYKRRVGLAQALIHDPEILILDEPTDGLDPNQKAVVQALIQGLSKDKCIILSTHILDEVERVCNRAIIVSEGRVLVDSTPRELIERAPNHNVVRLVLVEENPELVRSLEGHDWCARVETFREAIGAVVEVYPANGENRLPEILATADGVRLESVHQQEGRLDELFREVTQGVSR